MLQTILATRVDNLQETVGHDAPEVVDGNKPSLSSDIYSLSFTLYELLTGTRPFRSLKPSAIVKKYPPIVRQIIERGWSHEPS